MNCAPRVAGFCAAVGSGGSVYEALAFAFSLYAFLRFIGSLVSTLPASVHWLHCYAGGFTGTGPYLLVFPASMPVESPTYFSYALPAYMAFYGG